MSFNNNSKLGLATLLLAVMLSGCSENKTTTEFIAEAKVAVSNDQNSLAIINLKNVLKTEKNNLEARFMLGSVYAKQGLWLNAEKELIIAKNAGYSDQNLNVLLIKVYYRLEDAQSLNSFNDADNDLGDLVKIYLAILDIKQGNIEKGRTILNEVILVNNNQDISKLAMAWEGFLNNKYKESLDLLDTLAIIPLIQEDIIELRIVNLAAQKKHDAAAQQLELFLSLRPQSHIHRLQLAEQYVKYRNYSDAEKNADHLLVHYKNNVMLNRIKAEIKFNDKNYLLAKQFAEITLRNSDDVLSKIIAGMSAYQLGQYESSYSYLSSVSSHFNETHPVNQILKLLSNELTFSIEGENQELQDSILSLIENGDYKQTRKLLKEAAKFAEMDNGVTDFRLGLLKIVEGDSSFTDDFERAISNGFDGIEPKVLLAQQYLKDKEYLKVLEIAESLSSTNQVTALLLEGSVFLEKGELEQAIAVYETILSTETEHIGALFKLSDVYLRAGDTLKSIEYLKQVYSSSSLNLYAVRYLFKFSLTPSYKEVLEQFFISEVEKDKKNINRHIVLAEFYLLHNELEQALSITSRYLLKSPEQLEISLIKIKILLSLNRVSEAKNSLIILEKTAPRHSEVIMNKALIFNIEGNNVEAIKVIENFAIQNNDVINDDLLIMLTTLYAASKQPLEAMQTLSKVKNKQNVKYVRIEGKVALMRGDNRLAIKSLSKAFESNPSELIALELAQALQNDERIDEAIQFLESSLLNEGAEMLILMKYKLTELCERKCPIKAERYHKELLVETNRNVASLNNIAWFYYVQQRYAEAKVYANQAVKSAPQIAATHNTLGVILLELDELKQAKHHLQVSVNLKPQNDKYKIWLAKCLILDGDTTAAEVIRSEINMEALSPEGRVLFNKVFERNNK